MRIILPSWYNTSHPVNVEVVYAHQGVQITDNNDICTTHLFSADNAQYVEEEACITIPPTYCGDGFVDHYIQEECDDGNTEDGDGCSSTCQNENDDDIQCLLEQIFI